MRRTSYNYAYNYYYFIWIKSRRDRDYERQREGMEFREFLDNIIIIIFIRNSITCSRLRRTIMRFSCTALTRKFTSVDSCTLNAYTRCTRALSLPIVRLFRKSCSPPVHFPGHILLSTRILLYAQPVIRRVPLTARFINVDRICYNII